MSLELTPIVFAATMDVPVQSSDNAAGFDVTFEDKENGITLAPREIKTVGTGLKLSMDSGIWAKVEVRASWASRGLLALGTVINPDIHREVQVILHNLTDTFMHIPPGAKVVQLVFHKRINPLLATDVAMFCD